jgi:hypothetical protein
MLEQLSTQQMKSYALRDGVQGDVDAVWLFEGSVYSGHMGRVAGACIESVSWNRWLSVRH